MCAVVTSRWRKCTRNGRHGQAMLGKITGLRSQPPVAAARLVQWGDIQQPFLVAFGSYFASIVTWQQCSANVVVLPFAASTGNGWTIVGEQPSVATAACAVGRVNGAFGAISGRFRSYDGTLLEEAESSPPKSATLHTGQQRPRLLFRISAGALGIVWRHPGSHRGVGKPPAKKESQ